MHMKRKYILVVGICLFVAMAATAGAIVVTNEQAAISLIRSHKTGATKSLGSVKFLDDITCVVDYDTEESICHAPIEYSYTFNGETKVRRLLIPVNKDDDLKSIDNKVNIKVLADYQRINPRPHPVYKIKGVKSRTLRPS